MQYLFPRCTVIIDEAARYVETRFEDGSTVGSTPNTDDHTLQLADELGYGADTWTMSKDHEICHTWLAHLDGEPWSATFWRIAHPDLTGAIGDDEVADEEARVLAFQRTLPKDQPRPWDTGSITVDHSLPW
ncbi:MAG: hypothetical protein JWN99_3403 [Ilumatobacteraceae bacterium]|nr:hypothetical protein [Ilumatobacteraceae bacterium]